MKRMIVGSIGVLLVASMACADTYTYSLTAAVGSTNVSAAIPVSGYLDKIEISGAGGTSTVVIATYAGALGTTAVDTLATLTLTTPKVIRLRVQPTDNTGTVIPAVYAAGGTGGTNAATMLVVPYDKVLVGGNIKISTIDSGATGDTTKYVFYYEPLKK